MQILGVELTSTPREMIDSWNHQTAVWLRYYVYERSVDVNNPKNTTFPRAITFVVSAFWHGHYPVYYVVFLTATMLSEVGMDFYRCKIYYDFLPSIVRSINGQ